MARVDSNNIGDVLTFWRDEKVTNPDAVFARSNMFWDEYKVAWQMSLPGGYDGVALDYVDPLTNKKAYIYLQIDSSGITEVEDATVNAMQISLDGCRNATQATDRAWLEARKILYSRLTMTVKVLEEPRLFAARWFSVLTCTTTRSKPFISPGDPETYLRPQSVSTFLSAICGWL